MKRLFILVPPPIKRLSGMSGSVTLHVQYYNALGTHLLPLISALYCTMRWLDHALKNPVCQ